MQFGVNLALDDIVSHSNAPSVMTYEELDQAGGAGGELDNSISLSLSLTPFLTDILAQSGKRSPRR